jgi:hypothetical protein
MKKPQIQSTTDYSIFKFVSFNREKQKSHIENLKHIIQENNLLAFHPIIVNEKMEVIDGQHRLAAAQDLGLEIYYVLGDVDYSHILNANLIQKRGSVKDAIKFYAVKDHLKDYILLIEYMKKLELDVKAMLCLLLGTSSHGVCNLIQKGKFIFPSDNIQNKTLIDSYEELLCWAKERRLAPLSMIKSAYFTSAFRYLIISGIPIKILLQKLSIKWFELKPQANSKQWMELLISIYNFKNHQPFSLDE